MARKGGLGKGLDALIPGSTPTSEEGGELYVPIDKVDVNPRQPRNQLKVGDLEELAASIREYGVLQPLMVSYDAQTDQYTLIAGERRWRAALMAGLNTVPVIVRQVSDQQRLEMALIENIQRADLSPLETAEAYRQLSEDFNLSHEEIAARVGKSRTSVTNTLRLLKLPEQVQIALAENKISEGHARALLSLESPSAQLAALQITIREELSVRQVEALVKKLGGHRPASPPSAPRSPEIQALEDRLRSFLGTRVVLRHGKKGGSLVIHYYSDEELDALVAQILRE